MVAWQLLPSCVSTAALLRLQTYCLTAAAAAAACLQLAGLCKGQVLSRSQLLCLLLRCFMLLTVSLTGWLGLSIGQLAAVRLMLQLTS